MSNKKRSKYGIDQTQKGIKDRTSKDFYTGEPIVFMSKLERQFYEEYVIKGLKDGTIEKYKLQQRYKLLPSFRYQGELVREINYISDFDIWYTDGNFTVFDTKGRATTDSKLKAKLFKNAFPDIDFKWMSYTKATGWIEYYDLEKIRRNKKKNKGEINYGK